MTDNLFITFYCSIKMYLYSIWTNECISVCLAWYNSVNGAAAFRYRNSACTPLVCGMFVWVKMCEFVSGLVYKQCVCAWMGYVCASKNLCFYILILLCIYIYMYVYTGLFLHVVFNVFVIITLMLLIQNKIISYEFDRISHPGKCSIRISNPKSVYVDPTSRNTIKC